MTHERRTIPLAKKGFREPDCPLAPSEQASVYAKSLHRACLILGGMEALEKKLEVPREMLERWIRGHGEPPMRVFHLAVEIILLFVSQAGRH